MTSEPAYEVVSPLGRDVHTVVTKCSHPADLTGKNVAFVWDYLFKGPEVFDAVRELMDARYAGVTYVGYERFGNIHGHDEEAVVGALPDRLRDASVDIAVVGVGACGSCTPAVMRAAAVIERAGIPAVTVCADGFELLGRHVAEVQGVPWVPIVCYPGVPLSDTSLEFTRKVRDLVAPRVVDALIREPDDVDAAAEPTRVPFDTVVARGSLDDVQTFFEERLWSDGLPIVPPTPDRVRAFLEHTKRDPDEVLGVLGPAQREASVWTVAVNGVMAGCRPEYMPVLVAAVAAVADPAFLVEQAGSTPGWEPMVIVSGPLARELDFNAGTAALRIGRRANSTVGRFVRLYLRNVAGLLPPPGSTDQGAIAQNFHVALAEDDVFVRSELTWPTYREDHGFGLADTVVGVQGITASGVPIYTSGDSAEDHLSAIARCFADTLSIWGGSGIRSQQLYPLLVVGPSVAKALDGFGVGKDALRDYLGEHLTIRAGDAERYLAHVGGRMSIAEWVRAGEVPARYGAQDDPDRLVPMLPDPALVQIVVAGNPGRNQCKAFAQQNRQGRPVVRAVDVG